uniref:Uncharacterized protein n=1 Tax=Rhizophora mucronata TaxID=61149 RepID=A0A2P2PVS1_RHIMU
MSIIGLKTGPPLKTQLAPFSTVYPLNSVFIMRPPILGVASSIKKSRIPASFSVFAAERPDIPAPMMITVGDGEADDLASNK